MKVSDLNVCLWRYYIIQIFTSVSYIRNNKEKLLNLIIFKSFLLNDRKNKKESLVCNTILGEEILL